MAQNFLSDIKLGDNIYIRLGDATNGDLQIYHNATNSYIKNITGDLKLASAITTIRNEADTETLAKFTENGAVELYYDNSKKLETANTGIVITGNADPATDSLYDLGTDTVRWANVYADTLHGDGSNITGVAADKSQAVTLTVKNKSGGSLSKGTIVHAHPSVSPPSGNVIEVIAADNDDTTKMPAIGILNTTLADEAEGEAIMFGRVSGISTTDDGTSTGTLFSIGDELYVSSTPGLFTNVKPTGTKLIQKIAVVIKSHATNGTIEVFGAGRTNDVPTPLYIDHANQRVGIGETSPSRKLHLTGGDFYTPDKSDTIGAATGYGGNSFQIRNGSTSEDLNFDIFNRTTSAWYTPMVIKNTGNVGIGTVSPQNILHVHQADAASHSYIHITQEDGGSASTDGMSIGVLDGGVNASIRLRENGYLNFWTNNTERMRIDNGGQAIFYGDVTLDSDSTKLKIGDSQDLQLYHDGSHSFIDNNTGTLYLRDTSASGSILLRNSNGGDIQFDNEFAGNILFNTSNIERARIDSSGNVGIASTDVQKNLSIGNAQGDGIQFNYDTTNNYRNQILNYWNSNTDTRMDFNIARTSGQTPETIMSVGYNSNVGIGTTSPDSILQIANNDGSSYRFGYGGTSDVYLDADNIYIRTDNGGSNTATFTTTGLGIGTVSPGAKLDIHAATNSNGLLIREDTDDSITHNFYIDSADNGLVLLYANGQSAKIQLNTAGDSYFDGGNVGIGVTSPGHKLDVSGNIRLQGGNRKIIYNNGSVETSLDQVAGATAGLFTLGNVGIGTATPSNKVHIYASDGSSYLRFTSDVATTGSRIGLNSDDLIIENQQASGDMIFDTNSTERMRIASDGSTTFAGDVTVRGGLIVNGTQTILNTQTLSVDDKNIELGDVTSTAGVTATLATATAVVTVSSTTGFLVGATLTKTAGTGAFGTNAVISSIDSATQFTASVNHATAGAITFTVGGASNATADGGGITLKAAADKTILWTSSTDTWDFNTGATFAGGIIQSMSNPYTKMEDTSSGGDTYGLNNNQSKFSIYNWTDGREELYFGGDGNATFAGTTKATTFLINRTTAAGVGASLGDINGAELGPGYLSLSRDDTANAKQIVFEKNDAEHSYIQTEDSNLRIVAGSSKHLYIDTNNSVSGMWRFLSSGIFQWGAARGTLTWDSTYAKVNASGAGMELHLGSGDDTDAVKIIGSNTTFAGDVGIGGAPSAALDITTAGNTTDGTYYSTFTINNTGTSTWSRIRFDRSGVARWGLALSTDDKFKISNLFTGGTTANPNDNVLVIDEDSNIGIGTSNPESKLHLYRNDTSTNELLIENDFTGNAGLTLRSDDNVDGSTFAFINFDANSSTNGNTRYARIRAYIEDNTQDTQDGKLVFTTIKNASDFDQLTLDSSGATFAGVLALPDGSVSAPSIGNTGDTNTGMYWPSDHQLGFAVNGSRKFYMSETEAFFQNLSSGVSINAGGIDVTGNSTFAGTVTANDDLILDNSSPEIYFKTGATHYNWMIAAQENISAALEFTPANAVGTTGTHNAPALTLYANRNATFAGNVDLDSDSAELRLGDGQDLSIYYNGTNGFITYGTSGLYIQGDYPRIQSSGGENMIAANVNAEVNLYFNNVNKFQTTSYGTNTSGRGTIVDTTNPGGDGTASGGGVLTVEGRRDGTANVLTLRARDESAPAVALPDGQGSIVRWQGFDGTDFAQMGAIAVLADGQAVANSDAPSKMVFYTVPDATETLTPALTLDKSQNATFAGAITSSDLATFNNGITLGGSNKTLKLLYNNTANYRGNLGWSYLQLGNNGSNDLVAGNTAAGGQFRFFVNNTNDIAGDGNPNGTLALTLASSGNATFSGDVQIDGDLIVTGATTSVNVEDLNVEQGEITLNYGTGDTSAAANGSGIRIQDAVNATTDATILWDATNDEFDFSHGATFAGNVELGDSSNISMSNAAPGQLQIQGSGYTGAIALNATAMYIYHNSSLRDLVLGTNETARLTIDGSNGNATFAGAVTVGGNVTASSGTGHFAVVNASAYQLNGTYVMDSSRNLVNIGTIGSTYFSTSSNINSTGDGGVTVGGYRLGFDQSGTRSWTMKADGGNLNVFSGDGNGGFNLSLTDGLITNTINTRSGDLDIKTVLTNRDIRMYDGNSKVAVRVKGDGTGTDFRNADTRFISLNYEDSVNTIKSHAGSPNFGIESLNIKGDIIRFYTDYDANSLNGDLTLTLDNNHNATFTGSIYANTIYSNTNSTYYIDVVAGGTGLNMAGSATFEGDITAPGQYGESYSVDSTSGTVAIIDTLTLTATDHHAVYEVVAVGNPNNNGSSLYRDIIFGKIIVSHGYTAPNVLRYIHFVRESPLPRDMNGSGTINNLTMEVVFWDGSSESETFTSNSGTPTIRVKIDGYVGTVGANTSVRLKRIM